MQEVRLDSSKYSDFCRIISNFKDICNDIDIQGGFIRQKTNDKISTFEIDLNPLIGDLSFTITHLKTKLDLFKLFVSHDVTMIIDEDNSSRSFFSIRDSYSSLSFLNPSRSFVDNKYMTEEELNRIISVTDDDLLLSTTVSELISNRIKVVSVAYDVPAVTIKFDGDEASLCLENQSGDQFAGLIKEIPTEKNITALASITVSPFIFEHNGDTDVKIYEMKNNKALSIVSTVCGDVNIVVYCRSTLTHLENNNDNDEASESNEE